MNRPVSEILLTAVAIRLAALVAAALAVRALPDYRHQAVDYSSTQTVGFSHQKPEVPNTKIDVATDAIVRDMRLHD